MWDCVTYVLDSPYVYTYLRYSFLGLSPAAAQLGLSPKLFAFLCRVPLSKRENGVQHELSVKSGVNTPKSGQS